METLRINTFGREVVNGKWYISPKCNVNRIYFVNSGYALIQNGAHRYKLTEGKTYIIPKCNNFAPIEAKNFDHTFFDFYSEKILSPQKVIELNESMAEIKSFFDFINSIVLTKKIKSTGMQWNVLSEAFYRYGKIRRMLQLNISKIL